jgi:hypothetical protein
MGNPRWAVRNAAREALERLGETAEIQIRKTLHDPDLALAVRGELLSALGKMDALQDDDLVDALRYGDVDTRIIAATRLGEIETHQSYKALNDALRRDENPDVIKRAEEALKMFAQKKVSFSSDDVEETGLLATWRRADDWFVEVVKYFREVGFFQEAADLSDAALVEAVRDQYMEIFIQPPRDRLTSDADLLCVLACDRERVWWRDLEADVGCRTKVYVQTLKEWSQISCGSFIPKNISEAWDGSNGPVHITFDHKGEAVHLRPEYLSDYIDLNLLTDINEFIEGTGIRFEVYKPFDQSAYVISLTPDQKRRLQRDLDWFFLLS